MFYILFCCNYVENFQICTFILKSRLVGLSSVHEAKVHLATAPGQGERERSVIFLVKVEKHPILFYVNF